jgi:hypothetical protein
MTQDMKWYRCTGTGNEAATGTVMGTANLAAVFPAEDEHGNILVRLDHYGRSARVLHLVKVETEGGG